jgi:hypothetical protein
MICRGLESVNVAAGELAVGVLGDVAFVLAAVAVGEPFGTLGAEGVEFGVGPDVEGAFGLLVGLGGVGGGIGVFGGVEAAFGVGEIARDVVEDALRRCSGRRFRR